MALPQFGDARLHGFPAELHGLQPRLFTSVHGVYVVILWSA